MSRTPLPSLLAAHQAVVAARGGSDTILKGPKTKDGDVVIGVNSEYTVEAIKVILEFIYTASVQGVLDLAKKLAGTPIALASILTEVIELSKVRNKHERERYNIISFDFIIEKLTGGVFFVKVVGV